LTWYLEAMGTDFSVDIPITQLEWSPAAAATWNAFSTTYTQHATGGKTTGWATEDEDYQYQCQADDPAGTYNTYLFYRLYAQ